MIDMIPDKDLLAGMIEASPYPIYLILGEELIVAVANAATLSAWGKDKSVVGKRFSEALPELAGQPFEALLRKVMLTGEAYHAVNDRADLMIDGVHKTSYYTFSYLPVTAAAGGHSGVICFATDVTSLVESAAHIERLNLEAQIANEGLAQMNEELVASNEEMVAANEEIAATNEELTEANNLLEVSERRFRNLILQSPFAICVIRAADLIVTDVNDRYLELVGKSRQQLSDIYIWDGVPEAADYYAPVMQEVIDSRIPFFANEAELFLLRGGIAEQIFVDFVYEPVIDLNGDVSAIMVVGMDVSDKVRARMAIEEAEERIRLAVNAANIGTFDYYYIEGELKGSEQFYSILGQEPGTSRENIIASYHPEDAHLSANAHESAKATGRFSYEARIILKGQPIRWVRFEAKVYLNAEGNPYRSLGTVVDITDYKTLQEQKDDFISIASHELKTPITSLKAYLQLIARMREKPDQAAFPRMIDQATRSMDKITALVDDLLNVSKMNQGQVALSKKLFLINDLLETCCVHVRDAGRQELVIEGDLDLIICADEHRIDQVVTNLVDNAVKYAPDSKQILLRVERMGDMARIWVTDTGTGIAKNKQNHLFERYFRADNSGIKVSGLGLGLYISADIIHRHGGEIGVESEIGKGSNFWFTLPLGDC